MLQPRGRGLALGRRGGVTRVCAVILATWVIFEYHVGVTTLEYHVPVAGLQESATFPRSSNHQSQPGIEPGTPAPEAKVLTTRPRAVPYTSRAGTGICAPPQVHLLEDTVLEMCQPIRSRCCRLWPGRSCWLTLLSPTCPWSLWGPV